MKLFINVLITLFLKIMVCATMALPLSALGAFGNFFSFILGGIFGLCANPFYVGWIE